MDGLEQKVISLTERLKHLEEEYYHNKTEMKEEIKELTQVQIETNKQLALLNVTVQNNIEATKECTKHMKEQLNKPNEFVDKLKYAIAGGAISFLWSYILSKIK